MTVKQIISKYRRKPKKKPMNPKIAALEKAIKEIQQIRKARQMKGGWRK